MSARLGAPPLVARMLGAIAAVALLASPTVAGPAAGEPGAGAPGAAVAASRWTTVAVVPWGRGTGELFEDLASTDSMQAYPGPTRFLALGGGRIAILDTLASAVKEIDGSGRIVRTLSFPAHDAHDAETQAIDMAASPDGTYWLLSRGRQALLRVGPGGIVESRPMEGLKPDSIPTRIASDARGDLFVLDSADNTVRGWDAAGRALAPAANDIAASMVVDDEGSFLGFRLLGRSGTAGIELTRWTPPGPVTTLSRLTALTDIARFDVFGVDRAGNVYAMVAQGAIEHPRRISVMRFDSHGRATARADAPPDPFELPLLHGKAVSPDGVVYAATVTATALTFQRLTGF